MRSPHGGLVLLDTLTHDRTDYIMTEAHPQHVTVYLPREERGEYGRDCTHRPRRWDDQIWEEWYVVEDVTPSAVVYQSPSLPGIEILKWHATGTFTTALDADGIHARIDASNWFDAVSSAYAYAGWSNPYFAA